MTEMLSFRRLQGITGAGAATTSVSELHGTMAGLLCADRDATYEQWLCALLAPQDQRLVDSADAPLRQLFETTQQELASTDMSFEPLLPDDDEPLTDRARALGEWCQGFLFGLAQATGQRAWSGESDEVLRDFAEISRLETAEDPDDEDDYVEIAEFVRIGVQLIRCECAPPPRARMH